MNVRTKKHEETRKGAAGEGWCRQKKGIVNGAGEELGQRDKADGLRKLGFGFCLSVETSNGIEGQSTRTGPHV